MPLADRLINAYRAFSAPTVLRSPPAAPPGPVGDRTRSAIESKRRRRHGGRIPPINLTRLRWLRKDIEDAQDEANSGNVRHSAQIGAWVRGDLVVGGLLSTRCSVWLHTRL